MQGVWCELGWGGWGKAAVSEAFVVATRKVKMSHKVGGHNSPAVDLVHHIGGRTGGCWRE